MWTGEKGWDVASRERQVVKVGMVNVLVNLALAVTKIVLGRITNSIAITLDGVNSLTDGFSSVLTIMGTKIAQKAPDHKHPFGYGRVEYLTSFTVAALIIAAGASSLNSAINSITDGATSSYSTVALVLIGVASVTKAALGIYTRRAGNMLDSDPLRANGTDSLLDSVVSASTLVAAILHVAFGISIESYLAAIISILIIKSGIEILVETSSKILGERQDPSFITKVEKVARSVDGVKLVSGIVLTDYGPSRRGGSLHVTVDANMTISEFDEIAREVHRRVMKECGVNLISVGVYPAKEADGESRKWRAKVARLLWSHEHVIEVRGLYLDPERKACRFDAVADYSVKDVRELKKELRAICEEALPGYEVEPRVLTQIGD